MQEASNNAVGISVILPAFNEAGRLPTTLRSITSYFRERKESYEVIVVNDGSIDDTATVVTEYQREDANVRLLSLAKNCGKGAAVRAGMLAACGELLLFNDADGATPIAEIERLEQAIAAGADVAIGSRAIVSSEVAVHAHLHRIIIGRVFNMFANLLLVPGIADTQCGFKLFRTSVAQQIFSLQREDGFIFDVELLFLARKCGARIAEVAVNWSDQPGSRVRLLSDPLKMFLGLLRIRFRSYGV